MKKAKRIEWLEGKEIYSAVTNAGDRTMTPITIKPPKDEDKKDDSIYLMDVITGTLYNPKTKDCLTSDVLKLVSYKIDPTNGKQVLDLKVEKED